jgi:hypothetical protein
MKSWAQYTKPQRDAMAKDLLALRGSFGQSMRATFVVAMAAYLGDLVLCELLGALAIRDGDARAAKLAELSGGPDGRAIQSLLAACTAMGLSAEDFAGLLIAVAHERNEGYRRRAAKGEVPDV